MDDLQRLPAFLLRKCIRYQIDLLCFGELAVSMECLMTGLAQDDQISQPLTAQTLIRPVVNVEQSRDIADLAPIASN